MGVLRRAVPLAGQEPRTLVHTLMRKFDVCVGVHPLVDVTPIVRHQVNADAVAPFVQWNLRQ